MWWPGSRKRWEDKRRTAVLDAAKARLRRCDALIREGEISAAVVELSHLLEFPELRDQVEARIARCGRDHAFAASRLHEHIGAVRPGFATFPANSPTTVIAFSGRQRRAAPYFNFIRNLVQPYGANAICVFDWDNLYYLGGIHGLGNSFAAAAASLRRMVTELGTRRLICFGLSSGGYGALRYGLELDADGALVFSPLVQPVLEGGRIKRITAALGIEPDPSDIDLRRLFAERRRMTLTRIVYGAGNPLDTESARALEPFPGVSLHPLLGLDDHNSMLALVRSGELHGVLGQFIDEVAARAPNHITAA